MTETSIINYPTYGDFTIYTPNDILKFRAQTFKTKEPTTLDWLEKLEEDSLLIDVGANIGIYTIPSALFHVKKVIAIEPEHKNFNMLIDNLKLNSLGLGKVEALQVAISTEFQNKLTKIYLSKDEVGYSCHQVGRNQNHLLETIDNKNRKCESVYCISLSSIVKQVCSYHNGPIHIKIDVDGIEEDVCKSLFVDKCISRIASIQIELNKEIDSHMSLINSLESAGFTYSEKQVEKAIRKEGTFKGFAEIVFRRQLPVANISKEYLKYMGTTDEKPVKIDWKISNKKLISLNKSKEVQISQLPPTYLLRNAIDPIECSKLFQHISRLVLSKNPEVIEFDSVKNSEKIKQNKRCIIPTNVIKEVEPDYLKELYLQASSQEFINKIIKIYKHAIYSTYGYDYLKNHFPNPNAFNGKQVICRLRHFIDLYGYSLDKHNDSPDTICALIIPLLSYSTSTSIIHRDITTASPKKIKKSDLTPSEFIDRGYYYACEDSNQLYHFKMKEEKLIQIEADSYTYREINLKPGEAFMIPNMLSHPCLPLNNDSYSKALRYQINHNFGHGVLPYVRDPYRPILLIDYLLVPSIQNEQWGTSENEAFLNIGDAHNILFKT